MSLVLTLIAHASTKAMRAGTFPDDDPLDARGRAEVARFLDQHDRPACASALCSPMRCAIETAEAMALRPSVEAALSDLDYGRWRGLRLSRLAESDPAALHAWLSDPGAAPHGGESLDDLLERVGGWIDSLTGDGRVLAITHAPVIRAALIHALGFDRKAAFDLRIAPMERITLSRAGDNQWNLIWVPK